MTTAIVCGMASEASIINKPCIIGAGNANSLFSKILAEIAAGANRFISIGICGGLNPNLQAGDIVIASSIVYGLCQISTDFVWSGKLHDILNAKFAKFTWSNTAIARLADKTALYKSTGADVVDEETYIMASLAVLHNLPFTALRVVCDPASFELPPAAIIQLTSSGNYNIGAILKSVLTDPWQIMELIKLNDFSTKSLNNLKTIITQHSEIIFPFS